MCIRDSKTKQKLMATMAPGAIKVTVEADLSKLEAAQHEGNEIMLRVEALLRQQVGQLERAEDRCDTAGSKAEHIAAHQMRCNTRPRECARQMSQALEA